MAKDVITRFRLETTQFDSKLKQQAKALAELGNTATAAGKDFGKFTQDSVAAAKTLGVMATSSVNTKDKLKELVGAYNEAAKAYENLTNEQKQTDFGKAMAESLTVLQQRIKDTKQELYNLGDAAEQVKSKSSGLFGEGGFTGMLAVTGGNLLASGIQKLGSEMADTIQQSIELARQGEGVRLAFERLNRPDLLDNLKEATHGTVSELELMKAAVKFDDFKLPVEELGTLLAFAQKKAKDTGQSVDYMVDSIVTGLGRKSLMILDNLGLSAAQIKDKMKESGDMTKAVAEIIKEQMAEAGEYVETAADRAARAAADATNEMEKLGREAQPFAEAWAGVWNEIKIGGMDFLTTVLGPIAESAQQIRNILNGEFKFKAGIPNLADGPAPSQTRQPGTDHKVTAPGGYVEITDKNTGAVIGGKHFENLQDTNGINAWRKLLNKTTTNKSGGKTPAQQAAEKVASAQHEYAQSIELAKMSLDNGTKTEADYKKQLLSAEERLWNALGDAYQVHKDPKYKQAQDECAIKIKQLGGEVTASIEAQKEAQEEQRKVKESAKQLAATQKKVSDALEEAATAYKNNDLKGYISAQKKVGGDVGQGIAAGGFTYTSGNLDAFIGNIKEKISHSDVGSDLYNALTKRLADATALGTIIEYAVKNGIDTAQFDTQELWKKIFGGADIPDEVWKNITKDLGKQSGQKIKINTNTGKEDKEKKTDKSFVEVGSQMVNGINSMVGSLNQIGLELPEGFQSVLSGIQGMLGVLQSIAIIVEAIEAMQQVGTFLGIFHNGGMVPHAANGYYVPGNRFSGDTTPVLANAGELILNKAAQSSIASQLEGINSMQNMKLEAIVTGEQIRLAMNNNGRRTGRGEVVQTNRR